MTTASTLPWFPFEIDAYLGNTMTLDTEGHGANLLMMLHYYRTGRRSCVTHPPGMRHGVRPQRPPQRQNTVAHPMRMRHACQTHPLKDGRW
jgi:hypothetical protein